MYGYGDEFVKRWSDEEVSEEEDEEAPANDPRGKLRLQSTIEISALGLSMKMCTHFTFKI